MTSTTFDVSLEDGLEPAQNNDDATDRQVPVALMKQIEKIVARGLNGERICLIASMDGRGGIWLGTTSLSRPQGYNFPQSR